MLVAMNFGIILIPHCMREMKDISLKNWSGCKWKTLSLNLLPQEVEEWGTDDTTLIQRVEPSSFGAAGDRLPVHLSSLKIAACLGDARTSTQSSYILLEVPEQMERDTASKRPGLTQEIESAKSVTDLKTSSSITGAKLQTHFEVLDTESGLKKIINGDFKRIVFIQKESVQKKTMSNVQSFNTRWNELIIAMKTQQDDDFLGIVVSSAPTVGTIKAVADALHSKCCSKG